MFPCRATASPTDNHDHTDPAGFRKCELGKHLGLGKCGQPIQDVERDLEIVPGSILLCSICYQKAHPKGFPVDKEDLRRDVTTYQTILQNGDVTIPAGND